MGNVAADIKWPGSSEDKKSLALKYKWMVGDPTAGKNLDVDAWLHSYLNWGDPDEKGFGWTIGEGYD